MGFEMMNAVTARPPRVEAVVRFLHARGEPVPMSELEAWIQFGDTQGPLKEVVGLAEKMGLVRREGEGWNLADGVTPEGDGVASILADRIFSCRKPGDDNFVFCQFYAWLAAVTDRQSQPCSWPSEKTAEAFNALVYPGAAERAMNATKWTAWRDWAAWLGLGWKDDRFHPNPATCLERALPKIFGKDRKLEIGDFVARTVKRLPFLDTGKVFATIPGKRPPQSLGLVFSSGLRVLHDEETVRLASVADAKTAWTLSMEPGHDIISQVVSIEWRKQ